MKLLGLITGALLLTIAVYTLVVIYNNGLYFVPVYISDLIALNWSGQFNLDLATYLILSALWVAWRHQFSAAGIALALIALVAGMIFFAGYVLIAIRNADGDFKRLLLGKRD